MQPVLILATAEEPKSQRNVHRRIKDLLNSEQYPLIKNVCQITEEKTGLPRLSVAYGILGLIALYMMIGHSAQLVCNFLGIAYPAFASLKAAKTKDTDDDAKWLIYWTAFGFLSLTDFWPGQIFTHIHVYWLFKLSFLLYLALPGSPAAERIFRKWVEPAIILVELCLGKVEPMIETPDSLKQASKSERK